MVCGMPQVCLARSYAEELDAADPLARFRDRFALGDPSLVYLNGNSLGALPLATLRRMEAVIREEWASRWPGRGTTGWTCPGARATWSASWPAPRRARSW